MNLSVLGVGVSIYTLLFITGIGFSLTLTRHRAYPLTISFGLAPVISSAIIIVIGTWFLTYHLSLSTLTITMAIIASLSIMLAAQACWQQPSRISNSFKNSWIAIILYAAVALIIGSTWNNYHHGYLYHRLSPDIASYGMTAEWLLQGHQTSNISLSYVKEILINAHRCGFPIIIALLTHVFGSLQANVFMMMQLFTFIFFACSAWTMTWIIFEIRTSLYTTIKMNLALALIASCVIANGGLIYYMSEGFYPQIISASLLNIVLALLIEGKTNRLNFLLATVLSAAMLPVYNECFAIVCLFIVGLFAINLFTRQSQSIKVTIFYGISLVMALILTFPISKIFFTFSVNNSANIANVGYPQPNWALPSDVIGLTNIFSSMKHYLSESLAISVTPFHWKILPMVFSIWVILELVKLCFGTDKKLSNVVITLLLSWLGIYAINLYLLYFKAYTPLNYLYDKVITNFSPILTLIFLLAILTPLHSRFRHLSHYTNSIFIYLKISLVTCLVLISMTSLAKDKLTFRDYVDIDAVIQIAQSHSLDNYEIIFNERGYRNGAKIGKFRYIDATSESIIGAMLQKQIVDQWWNDEIWNNPATLHCFTPHKEVVMIIRKQDLLAYDTYINTHNPDIVMNTSSYVVVKTHQTLASLLQGDRYANFSKIFVE